MEVSSNLVHVHIGKTLPKFNELFDSIYQTILINYTSTKIYIIISDNLIQDAQEYINRFEFSTIFLGDFNCNLLVQFIPASILENSKHLQKYKQIVSKNSEINNFRDSFWTSTTTRFFYIQEFMRLFKIQNVFHIENDIMLYKNLYSIQETLKYKDRIYVVKDAPNRVIPSIMYIGSESALNDLNNFILDVFSRSNQFLNDMDLLGMYQLFNYFPVDFTDNTSLIFDGAAIGQYLGGVDPRNLVSNLELTVFNNPSKGFINETAEFKIDNTIELYKKKIYFNHLQFPIDIRYLLKRVSEDVSNEKEQFIIKELVNAHIHSKQLYQFSSMFDLQYPNIISGERIIGLCDYIILTSDIYNFHQNLLNFVDMSKIIIIEKFTNININKLNNIFEENNNTTKTTLKLFVYTHILDEFVKYILPNLSSKYTYKIYLHNSDHSFNSNHIQLLESPLIKKVYSQNLDYPKHKKLQLLPIGLANSMWPHGDTLQLYKTIAKTYNLKKTKNVYININPNTFGYRKDILKEFHKQNIPLITGGKNFGEYLDELSGYRFCLALRGNGLDTHRFWECLYLGVIPIIINNKYTQMDNFIEQLRYNDIPFYLIEEESMEIIVEQYFVTDYFNDTLYKKFVKKHNMYIGNHPFLKLNYFT